jgi:hypothetical protein
MDCYEIGIRRLTKIDSLEAEACSGCGCVFGSSEPALVRFAVPIRETPLWFHRECFQHLMMGLEVFKSRVLISASSSDPN